MELSYDWKTFQSLFYLKRLSNSTAALGPAAGSTPGPIYLITDKKVVISAFSEGEDLSEWLGTTSDEVIVEFPNREIMVYDREKVDQWMSSSINLSHFYDQIQFFHSEAKPQHLTRSRFKNHEVLIHHHFLLQAIQSWWQKVFPSTYAIYIRLNGESGESLFMVIQRGRLSSFQIPDLSSMIPERRRHPADVVKYLSERHLMPVQGLFISSNEWVEWSQSANPWPQILSALKADRTKLAPFKWSFFSMIAGRAWFGI